MRFSDMVVLSERAIAPTSSRPYFHGVGGRRPRPRNKMLISRAAL